MDIESYVEMAKRIFKTVIQNVEIDNTRDFVKYLNWGKNISPSDKNMIRELEKNSNLANKVYHNWLAEKPALTARLDRIASELEQKGAQNLALAVDLVSDKLDKFVTK